MLFIVWRKFQLSVLGFFMKADQSVNYSTVPKTIAEVDASRVHVSLVESRLMVLAESAT